MTEEPITVDLGPENGIRKFRNYEHLSSWLQRERAKWGWIQGAGDPGNSSNRIFARFTNLENEIATLRAQGQPFSVWKNSLAGFFHPASEGILLANTSLGDRIAAIRDAYGAEAGAVAHSALRDWLRFTEISTVAQLRAVMTAASPSLLNPEQISERLNRERNNVRSSLRRMISEAEDAEENRARAWQAMLTQARGRTVAWTRKLALRWDRQRRLAKAEHAASISGIEAVKAAYNEFMRLQAPAEYWRDKAGRHKLAERNAAGALWKFFPIALITLAIAFTVTGVILLRPGPSHPTPVYFVVSAGLATFAGVVFWIGRLLTRLYLSEHHLRKDAEEREVMTTTYLALTRDQAAEEKDRHIILTALFRNSADGIVKDDGGLDPTLAGAIARLGTGR